LARGNCCRRTARRRHDACAITLDDTDPLSVEQARAHLEREFGRLDVLINNAGISPERDRKAPSETPLEMVRRTYETKRVRGHRGDQRADRAPAPRPAGRALAEAASCAGRESRAAGRRRSPHPKQLAALTDALRSVLAGE
jgi:NAD(P)-dependent dehydrogenase (short-subunit alcohol dehydrogenase family)